MLRRSGYYFPTSEHHLTAEDYAPLPPERPVPATIYTTSTRVYGTPAPQGSKRSYAIKAGGAYTGRTSMVDDNAAKLTAWRQAVRTAWEDGAHDGHAGPVVITATFYLPRPAGQYRTGRNAHLLKATAPARPAVKPDVDKLVRAVFDALTIAGAIEDDARVLDIYAAKHYADAEQRSGARITITSGGPA